MDSEYQGTILLGHTSNVLNELRVLNTVRNLVVELSKRTVEGVVRLEDAVCDPEISITVE